MKKKFLISMASICIFLVTGNLYAEKLTIADFNSTTHKNNLGDDFGIWGPDPAYCVVGIKDTLDANTRHGDEGNSLKLEYDIDTDADYGGYSDVSNPSEEAYNGFWMKLGKVDTEGFDKLVFFVKGDETTDYTTRLRVEIRNSKNELGRYLITDITDEWKMVTIPFSDKAGIRDWSRLAEFNIKFDTANCDAKVGTIYLDDIYLSNE